MKKIELLAPAGDMESLKAAVSAGCDAIYLAGQNFGARAFANNFSNEELKVAIDYCHLYNVKVHITINTLIYDDEIDELINYVTYIHKLNVDAVIVQDIGIIHLLRNKFPNLVIHASTQVNTHNKETVKFLKSIGVQRVIFARETSLDEIKSIDVDVEKEVFIHGALCVSYSGQCLLSSVIGNRSGNRGLCAGPCRLKYKLLEVNDNKQKIINTNGEYLLSTKDLCTLENLDSILNSNINSLKIEGRMKRKEYVYLVVSIYRKAIDNYYKYGKTLINDKDIKDLKLIFNRDFTKGFLFNEEKKNINNSYRPNHLGIKIGKVINYQNNKITIRLIDSITKGDGIRIIDNNEDIGFNVNKIFLDKKVVDKASAGKIVILECKNKVSIDSDVIKTTSIEQLNKIKELVKIQRKIPINLILNFKLNKCAELICNDNKNITKSYSKTVVEKAQNIPITKEVLITKLSKLGDTPFSLNNIQINIDNNTFLPISEINDMRRKVVTELINLRTKSNTQIKVNDFTIDAKYKKDKSINLKCYVKTEEQLKACIDMKVEYIYVDSDLYQKYAKLYNNLILVLPRINKNYKELNNTKLLVRELGSIDKYKSDNTLIADYTLNITNSYSIDLMHKFNFDTITLSPEMSYENIKHLIKNITSNVEIIIYGNIELMITKYCILNKHLNKNKVCSICKNEKKYYLIDRKNEKYKITTDNMCNNIINDYKKINMIDKINCYKELGINNYRINFLEENYDECINVLLLIYKIICK